MKNQDSDCDHSFNFGFGLLRDKQLLKLRLDAAGREGLISFIQALIHSGICDREDIIEAVLDITGPHMEATVADILVHEAGMPWAAIWNDTFAVRSHYRELF